MGANLITIKTTTSKPHRCRPPTQDPRQRDDWNLPNKAKRQQGKQKDCSISRKAIGGKIRIGLQLWQGQQINRWRQPGQLNQSWVSEQERPRVKWLRAFVRGWMKGLRMRWLQIHFIKWLTKICLKKSRWQGRESYMWRETTHLLQLIHEGK